MGRRKRKSAHKHPLCSVCYDSNSPSTVSIPCCSSHLVLLQHAICDSCLFKHISAIISKDITSPVICPKQGCNATLTHDTIQKALLVANRHDLWQEYALKSNWRGTSTEWIKRFSVKCPGCRVPIEKNGGCNQMVCRQCHLIFNWERAKMHNKMNPFGGNAFGGGFPPQFPGSFPQQGFGQFGSGGGFFNGGAPFQGGSAFPGGSAFQRGNAFPGGSPFQGGNAFSGGSPFQGGSQFPPSSGFRSPPMGGQFGQGFGFPAAPGGFGYQQSPYGAQFPPGQQPPYGDPNYFGSGAYGRPRSRHASRHRSHSHRRKTSSSSSSDDNRHNRGSPFAGRGNPYGNIQPFPNMPPVPPRGGSPLIPPRRPAW